MYLKDKWTTRGDESRKDYFRQITRKQGYVWESPAMIHSSFQEAKQSTDRAVCVCAAARDCDLYPLATKNERIQGKNAQVLRGHCWSLRVERRRERARTAS